MVNVYKTCIIADDYQGIRRPISIEKGDEMKLLQGEKGNKINYEELPKEYRKIIGELILSVKDKRIKNTVLELKIFDTGSI